MVLACLALHEALLVTWSFTGYHPYLIAFHPSCAAAAAAAASVTLHFGSCMKLCHWQGPYHLLELRLIYRCKCEAHVPLFR